MNSVRELVRDAAIGVGVADTLDGLSCFKKPGCAAAILRRQPDPNFQRWIEAIDPGELPKIRTILPPGDVESAMVDLFDAHGVARCPQSAWLIQDIATLAAHFNALVPAPFTRLRLDVTKTDACRRFHIDAVVARLICTYRGTGTQYGISTDGNEPQKVFTVPTGVPMVLRGNNWPEPPCSGLLHRSPPIAGTGEVRLVLVIDPVFDPENEI